MWCNFQYVVWKVESRFIDVVHGIFSLLLFVTEHQNFLLWTWKSGGHDGVKASAALRCAYISQLVIFCEICTSSNATNVYLNKCQATARHAYFKWQFYTARMCLEEPFPPPRIYLYLGRSTQMAKIYTPMWVK
jgi:hypothetical protein